MRTLYIVCMHMYVCRAKFTRLQITTLHMKEINHTMANRSYSERLWAWNFKRRRI